VAAFEADIDLMVHNAVTFNGAESEVGKLAVMLQERTQDLIQGVKANSSKKRKDGDSNGGTPQPSKKAKFG
jgi:transcription initiation factor TFIID subunit 2